MQYKLSEQKKENLVRIINIYLSEESNQEKNLLEEMELMKDILTV